MYYTVFLSVVANGISRYIFSYNKKKNEKQVFMVYFPKKYKLKITQIKKLYSQGTALLTVVDGFATGSEHLQN
jgi:uncharacterized membrane-anchored protein YitT (DUF2179 family)